MKVLQINAVYGISSTGRTTKELDEYLLSQGIDSLAAVAESDCVKDNVFIIGSKADRKIHALMSRVFGKQAYFSKLSTKKFIKYIKAQKPDIIHLRNLHGNYINFPDLMEYIIEKKIPVVLTLHDCWFFTGKCCHYTEGDCLRWQKECGNCPELKTWNKSWFFDRSAEMLKEKRDLFSRVNRLAVVGVSDWITNEAEKSILKNAFCVKRIYNWIDLDIFKPDNGGTVRKDYGCESSFVVLGVSVNWSAQKGINIFVELAKKMPEVKFLMVGNIPYGFKLPPNMISVGSVSDTKRLAQFYSAADVFLNPSVQETFGKTTAEAIASGTPVIGFNLTATPELIGNGCGAVLEPDCGIDGIVNAVNEIKNNGKGFYKEKCVEYAHRSFDKETLIEDYITLYRTLIENNTQ